MQCILAMFLISVFQPIRMAFDVVGHNGEEGENSSAVWWYVMDVYIALGKEGSKFNTTTTKD